MARSGLCGQTDPDFREAEKWYRIAAESGNAHAQNAAGRHARSGKRAGTALALMLEDGQPGVPRDAKDALKWHLKAAEQGNALMLGRGGMDLRGSQFCSASLLSKEGHNEEAMAWLHKSADQAPWKTAAKVADVTLAAGRQQS
eukprot:Skav213625  [mRNA]  locus=scaffold2986:613754:616801:+ [translate_table: standard]